VPTAHDLYRTMGNIDVCIESKLLEVNVPIVFLGTVGFSPPREGRYHRPLHTTEFSYGG